MGREFFLNDLNITNYFLFTLFHHDVSSVDDDSYYNTNELYSKTIRPINQKNLIKNIADSLYEIVTENLLDHNDSQISLTLTGGMDSRIILACLLKAGIKPNCFTYGCHKAGDIYFAKKIAVDFGLNFHNAIKNKPNSKWYYKWVKETIKRDNGKSHLHRAHRTAAIAEHVQKYSPKVLFTGHMGGEGLRGLSFNNYFTSNFFKYVNENREKPFDAAKKVLDTYFIKYETSDLQRLMEKIANLSWMQHKRDINILFLLYDLVGKVHHTQDIRLYSTYVPSVVPVYLQKKYLDVLFCSPYHFLAKRKKLLGRLANPYVHCKLIEILYPELLNYPLSNGYRPSEYLKGLWYYVPIKTVRSFRQQKKFSPTFSYGQWFVDFIREHSANISPDIWEIYNRTKYFYALEEENHKTDEGYWHKFSNPIFFDLVEKQKKGVLSE